MAIAYRLEGQVKVGKVNQLNPNSELMRAGAKEGWRLVRARPEELVRPRIGFETL
jgi:hypothetical protein